MGKSEMGKYIVIEGGEGCGKSSQLELLSKYLKRNGFETIIVREPGGTEIGDLIRRILLKKDEYRPEMDPKTELFLYQASRVELIKNQIIPYLNKGYVVLSDRSFYSTMAYQGFGSGLHFNVIKITTDFAISFDNKAYYPDLSIFIDINPELGLKMEKGANRFSEKSLEFHRSVNQGYRKIADMYPDRIKVIHYIEGEKEEMHLKILGYVKHLLNFK